MRIIGPPSAEYENVRQSLLSMVDVSPRFVNEMLPSLWHWSVYYGINPVGVVAQSAKETGWGHFRGRVQPWFRNTCGLKVANLQGVMALIPTSDSDHPLCHAQFANWDLGALAHVQHLCAYAGLPERHIGDMPVADPRYTPAVRHVLRGLDHFEQLGGPGSWAPNPAYGRELVDLARKIIPEIP